MTSSLEILADNLKELRKKKGISQAELARKCEFSGTYISKIENGDRSPSLEKLDRMAEVLDVLPYKLLDPDCTK